MAKQYNAVPEPTSYIDPITGLEMTKHTRAKYSPVASDIDARIYNDFMVGRANWSLPTEEVEGLNKINWEGLIRDITGDYVPADSKLSHSQKLAILNPNFNSADVIYNNRAEHQNIIEKGFNTAIKFQAKTGINVVGGLSGAIYGIGNALITGDSSKIFDNDITRFGDKLSRELDSAMPVYKSADYMSSNFGEKMLRPLMFADEFADAMSFTAGAIISEYASAGLSSALVAPKALSMLNKLVYGEKVLGMTNKVSKVLSLSQKENALNLIMKGGSFARRLATGAGYEAAIEANDGMRQYREKRINDYMQANGITNPELIPSNVMEDIENEAQSSGMSTYLANLAILHASNIVQFPARFGTKFSSINRSLGRGVGESAETALGQGLRRGLTEAADGTIQASYKSLGKFGNYASNAYTFAKNSIVEGLWEEGMQNAVKNANNDYWMKRYDVGNNADAVSYVESLGNAIGQTYTSKEGWNDIGMGMLVGGIGSPGRGALPGKLGKTTTIDKETGEKVSKRGRILEGGFMGAFRERKEKRDYLDKIANDYNSAIEAVHLNNSFKSGVQSITTQMGIANESEKSINEDSKFGFMNSKDDSFFTLVNAAHKVGRSSRIYDAIEGMRKLSPEEFKAEFFSQDDATEMTAEKQKEIIDNLERDTNKIRDSRNIVDDLVETDPENNYNEADETYKDHLTYLASKAQLIDSRMESIVKKLHDITGGYLNGNSVKELYDIANKTNLDKNALTELQSRIKKESATKKRFETISAKESLELDRLNKENDELNKDLKVLNDWNDSSSKKLDKLLSKKASLKDLDSAVDVQDELYSVQKEIESINREKGNKLNEIKTKTQKVESNNSKIAAKTDALNTLSKEAEDTSKELDAFIKESYDKLNNKTRKEAEESEGNPEFKYDNYEEYKDAVYDLLETERKVRNTLSEFYDKDPLKASEIAPLITDLGLLTRMRSDFITLFNARKSFSGRTYLVDKIDERAKKFKEAIAKAKVLSDEIGKRFTTLENFKISIKTKDDDGNIVDKEFIVEIHSANKRGDKVGVIKDDKGNTVDIATEDTLKELALQGKITDVSTITKEEKEATNINKEVERFGTVDLSTGEYSLTGDIVLVGDVEYFKLVESNDNGRFTRYYEINENGTISPHYETEFEEEIKLLASDITKKFEGELFKYTTPAGKEMLLVGTTVSPFLSEEEYKDAKLPSSIVIHYPNGETSAPIKDEDIIKELVGLSQQALKDPNARMLKGKPIISYKEQRVTISYTLTNKKIVYRRRKIRGKYRSVKSYIFTPKNKETFPAYYLEPKDKTVDELITSEQELLAIDFHKITKSNTNNSTANNFMAVEDKTEVIQDKFLGLDGNMYTVVKHKDSLYAVPRKRIFYNINQTNGILFGSRFNPGKDKKGNYVGLESLVYDKEPELSKDTKEEVYDSFRLGKLLQSPFYTAGLHYDYTTESRGTSVVFRNRYNDDGTLKENEDKSNVRWFNFLRDKSTSSKEFIDKYKLRIVINNGAVPEVFDENDTLTPSTEHVIIDGKVVKGREKDADIRVVLVDKQSNIPILVDGKMLFTSIHTEEYDGFSNKDEDSANMKKFRLAVIEKLNNGTEVYTNIKSLSPGVIITEQPTTEEIGTEGNTYRARQRHSVMGRIVPEGSSFNSIKWGIVKKTNSDTVKAVEIDGTVLPNNIRENGQVFTAISDRNGNLLKTKLLTRPLNQSEVTTVAQLIKRVMNGQSEVNDKNILPIKDISDVTDDNIISRLIRWGTNKNNPSTQIFIDKKSGKLILGNDYAALTKSDINSEEGFNKLKDWLTNVKIHHVAERYNNAKTFIAYSYNTETKEFDEIPYTNYNEYLFTDKNGTPVLSTDVIKIDESGINSNQLAQVNIEYDTAEFGIVPKTTLGKNISNNQTKENTQTDDSINIEDYPLLAAQDLINDNDKETLKTVKDTIEFFREKSAEYKAAGMNNLKANVTAYDDAFAKYKGGFIESDTDIGLAQKLYNSWGLTKEMSYEDAWNAVVEYSKGNNKSSKTVTDETTMTLGVEANSMFIAKPSAEDFSLKSESQDEKIIIEDNDNPFRLQVDSSNETRVSKEEEEWFKKTFPNIPLSIGQFKVLTNNKAWGVTIKSVGVLVSDNAAEGTIYHEAWHTVRMLALPRFTQKRLFSQVRNKYGKNITDKQADEILADDFMNWKLSGKSEVFAETPVKRNAFERILDFITKMYNSLFKANGLDIYKKIDSGGYSYINTTKRNNESAFKLSGLSVDEAEGLLEGISSLSIQVLYEKYNGAVSEFGQYFNDIFKEVLDNKVLNNKMVPQHIKDYLLNPANIGEFTDNVKQYLEYISVDVDNKTKEKDDNDIVVTEEERGRAHEEFMESIHFSALKNVGKEVKLLIATLPQVVIGKDGKMGIVLNAAGLPKAANFGKTYNTILKHLSGTQSFDAPINGMLAKLEALSKKDPNIIKLVNRLNALRGNEKLNIWTKFRQAFTLNNYGFQTFLLGTDGTNRFVESNRTKASDKVKELWNNSYKESEAFNLIIDNNVKAVSNTINTYLKSNEYKETRFTDYLNALKFIGINVTEEFVKNNEQNIKLMLSDFADTLKTTIIYDLTNQFQTGRYSQVVDAYSNHMNMYIEAQHLNPEGKNVYEYSLNNYLTTVINVIKSCAEIPIGNVPGVNNRIETLYAELPHLSLVRGYSTWLKNIEYELDKTIPNLNGFGISNLEGSKIEDDYDSGVLISELSKTSLANLHIHSILNIVGTNIYPMFPMRQPADKALAPAITGMGFVSDRAELISNILGYLRGELKAVNNDVTKLGMFNNYSNANGFNSILSKATLDRLGLLSKLENPIEGETQAGGKIKDWILRDINKWIDSQIEANYNLFKEIGIIRDKSNSFSSEIMDKFKNVANIVEAFTHNYITSCFEQQYLFHGEFIQYGDFFKRTSGYTGTGKTFSRDSYLNTKIQGDVLNHLRYLKSSGKDISNRIDLAFKLSPSQRNEFPEFSNLLADSSTINSVNIITLKEKKKNLKEYNRERYELYKQLIEESINLLSKGKVIPENISNYMKAYESMDIADGLGYITIEQYREFLIKTGDWDLLGKQEELYNKIIRGEFISREDLTYFPVIKPQGFGPKSHQVKQEDGIIYNDSYSDKNYKMFFAKLSLIPIIPVRSISGLEINNLLQSMQSSGSTIAIMESGLKLGKENPIEFNGNSIEFMPSFNTDTRYWKIQVDMHSEIENDDNEGSQTRKLIWGDMFAFGIPIDYNGNNWKNLSEEEKINNSHFYSMYKEYVDIYKDLIDIEKSKLMKELSISKSGNNYFVSDYSNFVNTLKKEITSRRLPSNILDALKVDENGKMLFNIDALPIGDKIENILFSRIQNNLMRHKRPGASYVQTSNAFWKTTENLSGSQKKRLQAFAEELQFIRSKDGKIVGAEIYVPATYFKGIIKEGDNLTELVESGKLDKRLLHFLGYRIPTQGQNSMLPLIVKGFIPSEYGDTVVVPYEIVAQSGSDFDIDKLHIIRPAFVTLNGEVKYIEPSIKEEIVSNIKEAVIDIEDSDKVLDIVKDKSELLNKALLQNRLLEIQLDILSSPYAARNLLVPNGAEFLKEESDWVLFLKTMFKDRGIPQTIDKAIIDSFIRWRNNDKSKYEAKATPMALLSYKHELETALSFRGGKKGVGIFASQITANALFQQSGMGINNVMTMKKNGIRTPKPVKFNCVYNIVDNKPYLGGLFDVKDNLISEIYSEHLTANVDIAKDPFIFRLNTNGMTSGVKSLLLGIGVDRKWVDRFLNQPIIEEYISKRLINESLEIASTKNDKGYVDGEYYNASEYQNNETIIKNLLNKYGVNTDKIEDIEKWVEKAHNEDPKMFSTDALDIMIIEGANGKINSNQVNILVDFLEYMQYSRAYNAGVVAFKQDTKGIKNMAEADIIIDGLNDVYETGFFDNISGILNNTLLSGFNTVHANFAKAFYKSLFITEIDNIQNRIYSVVKEDLSKSNSKVNDRDYQTIKQSILTYLLQIGVNRYLSALNKESQVSNLTQPFNVEQIKSMLTGTDSIPRVIQSLIKDRNIQELFGELIYPEIKDNTTELDLLKTVNKKIDAVTSDRYSQKLEEYYESNPLAYNQLLAVAAIEFGLSASFLSFMKYFNSTRIGNILNPIINNVQSNESFSTIFYDINGFIDNLYLQNVRNPKFIPKVKTGNSLYYPTIKEVWGEKSHVLYMKSDNFYFGRKFIKFVALNETKSGKKNWINTIYKLEGLNSDGEGVYVKVNPKSSVIKEYHNDNYSADNLIMDKTNTISKETRETIIKYFNNKLDKIDKMFSKQNVETVRTSTIKLKDGKTYNTSDINATMLEKMGYTPSEINKILKDKIC